MPKIDEDHCAVCSQRITGHMWDPFCCEVCHATHDARAKDGADRISLDKYIPRAAVGL